MAKGSENRANLIEVVAIEAGKVKDQPRAAILIIHGFVEVLVDALVEAHCKHSKRLTSSSRDYPHSVKLVILSEMGGVICDDEFALLDWLRRLRNKAAHEPIFEVTKQDMEGHAFAEYRDPDKFYEFLMGSFCTFWNQHLHVFVPLFAKHLFDDRTQRS